MSRLMKTELESKYDTKLMAKLKSGFDSVSE